ncbi:MAG: hypothetical protein IPP45_10765 [Sphingomonadales bacterium]|nr:hypothetical protein [Sphingomonadales bacterium]
MDQRSSSQKILCDKILENQRVPSEILPLRAQGDTGDHADLIACGVAALRVSVVPIRRLAIGEVGPAKECACHRFVIRVPHFKALPRYRQGRSDVRSQHPFGISGAIIMPERDLDALFKAGSRRFGGQLSRRSGSRLCWVGVAAKRRPQWLHVLMASPSAV